MMNRKPDIDYIRKYINGELSPREMFEIEKASHEDEMLMDIILGLEEEKNQQAAPTVAEDLQQLIEKRSRTKTRKTLPFWTIGIAASLLTLMSIGGYLWLDRSLPKEQLAMDTDDTGVIVNSPIEEKAESEGENSSSRLAFVDSLQKKSVGQTPPRREGKEENLLSKIPPPQPSMINDSLSLHVIASNAEETVASAYMEEQKNARVAYLNNSPKSIAIRGAHPMVKKERSSNLDKIPLDSIKSITTGIVVNKQNQKPVAGAVIRDLKTNDMVLTDSTGQFILASKETNTKIQVQSIGFESQSLAANGSKRIELNPEEAMLEEVVVTGYGQPAKSSRSEPLMGNRAYGKLINKRAKESKLGKGTVTLVFSIDLDGRPSNIRVNKSAGTKLDRKAIDLIKNGPDWKRGNDNKEIEWKVKF